MCFIAVGGSSPFILISTAIFIHVKQPAIFINELCDVFRQQTLVIPSALI